MTTQVFNFPAQIITRTQITEELQNYLDASEIETTITDEELTDELCKEYVTRLDDIHSRILNFELREEGADEAEQALQWDILNKLGKIPPEEEEEAPESTLRAVQLQGFIAPTDYLEWLDIPYSNASDKNKCDALTGITTSFKVYTRHRPGGNSRWLITWRNRPEPDDFEIAEFLKNQ